MPPRIIQLPDNLISRIAAGEVVERPASVLKELLENSLDAGATEISIHVEGAGRTRLQVADNGTGMTSEEALLSLQRHATSKIKSYEDLESLISFGFRGEALPSIAAVSRFRMTTRFASNQEGWHLNVEGGKLLDSSPMPREKGTTIEIRDLFFNTPARFKFLKADHTERSHCLRVIEEAVFSSPHVTFRVFIEKSSALVFPGRQGSEREPLQERLILAWTEKWRQSIYVKGNERHVALNGFVTGPTQSLSTSKNQIFFINQRPVLNRRLNRAIYDAYRGQLPVGRHPGWVLFLNVNPQAVDVNVHPSKREVKLAFESEIYGFILKTVRSALEQSSLASVNVFPDALTGAVPLSLEKSPSFSVPRHTSFSSGRVKKAIDQLYEPEPLSPSASLIQTLDLAQQSLSLKAIAQIRNTFILAESSEGLVIIDQHAAAEKVRYEALMKNWSSAKPESQLMLVPFTWDVSLSVKPALEANLETLSRFGFQIEPFGGSTFILKATPSYFSPNTDWASLLDSLSDVIVEEHGGNSRMNSHLNHKLAAMTACKSSVRAGDPLDLRSCQALIDEWTTINAPQTCPHGRPTVLNMSYPELERKFRRT